VMEGLLTLLLSDRMALQVSGDSQPDHHPEAERLRTLIREGLAANRQGTPPAASPPDDPQPAVS
jgi:hypothetical protein